MPTEELMSTVLYPSMKPKVLFGRSRFSFNTRSSPEIDATFGDYSGPIILSNKYDEYFEPASKVPESSYGIIPSLSQGSTEVKPIRAKEYFALNSY